MLENFRTNVLKKIVQPTPDMTLTTDASTKGWGAVYGEQKTGGPWSLEEQGFHINYLELKAIWLGLKSLCNNLRQTHVGIHLIIPLQWLISMQWEVSNLRIATTWPSKFGCGALRGKFGSVPATYQAP